MANSRSSLHMGRKFDLLYKLWPEGWGRRVRIRLEVTVRLVSD